MEKVYARTKGIQPDMVDGFCPGCMHSTLFKLIGEVLEELGMLEKTITSFAPWHICESNDKKYARIKALKIVIKAIEDKLEQVEKN